MLKHKPSSSFSSLVAAPRATGVCQLCFHHGVQAADIPNNSPPFAFIDAIMEPAADVLAHLEGQA